MPKPTLKEYTPAYIAGWKDGRKEGLDLARRVVLRFWRIENEAKYRGLLLGVLDALTEARKRMVKRDA